MKFVKALFVTTLFFNLTVAIAASTAFPPESMLTPGAKLVVGEGPDNDFNIVDERDEARTRAATVVPHANAKKPVGPDVTPEMPAAKAPSLLTPKPVLPNGAHKLPQGLSAKPSKKATRVAAVKKTKLAKAKAKPKTKPTRIVNKKKVTKFRFAENHNRTIHTVHTTHHVKS